ncbi:glycosyltransferase involved in cell wall biosynthesis [Paraburkholderia graminis]|nr:glycosyltransferase involved in cell wall biosynthesis [Paraburkholderia graminis]
MDALQNLEAKDGMMRVFHLVLAPRLSGAEVLAKDLALDQCSEGMAVCMASLLPAHADFASLADELHAHGVECWFPPKRHHALGKLWNLFVAVRRFRPDVIFAHATIPSFYARALPLGAPVVYVMHSATNDFERPLFRRVEHVLSGRARVVIGVSQQGVMDYVQAIGVHPSMTVVPNGVDLARFAFTDGGERVSSVPQIVQIGRYASVKNQLLTVRAFSEVLTRIEDARLVLYGVVEDPDYQRAVVALATELGIGERVVVAGPRSDVATVLSESSVFVMPSRSEGHSVAFLEALASGVPIVASRIPAFAFANSFPGVQLVDTDDIRCYADAIVMALSQERVQRSLVGLTLRDTAERYRAIARQVCPAVSAR